jgi:hypothetical protein
MQTEASREEFAHKMLSVVGHGRRAARGGLDRFTNNPQTLADGPSSLASLCSDGTNWTGSRDVVGRIVVLQVSVTAFANAHGATIDGAPVVSRTRRP